MFQECQYVFVSKHKLAEKIRLRFAFLEFEMTDAVRLIINPTKNYSESII